MRVYGWSFYGKTIKKSSNTLGPIHLTLSKTRKNLHINYYEQLFNILHFRRGSLIIKLIDVKKAFGVINEKNKTFICSGPVSSESQKNIFCFIFEANKPKNANQATFENKVNTKAANHCQGQCGSFRVKNTDS